MMFTANDLAALRALSTSTLDTDAFGITITIRRSGSSLDPQVVRFAQTSSARDGRLLDQLNLQQAQGVVKVIGARTLDIAVGDKFAYEGIAYRVVWVDPEDTVERTAFAIGAQ